MLKYKYQVSITMFYIRKDGEYMDINKIFEKWVSLTEVDPTEKKMIITSRNIDIYNYNQEIKSAMDSANELDAAIVLRRCFYDYIQNVGFSIKEIINGEEEFREKINLSKELSELLQNDEIVEYEKEIYSTVNEMSSYYGISDMVENLSKDDIFQIVINAKKAMKYLSSVQFKKGNFSDENPKLLKTIHMFYNVNHLLDVIMRTDKFNGISLNCIVDGTNNAYTYFCFVIKNGDNVYMVSDKQIEHSISKKLCGRSSGRVMNERICQFLFPYELLDLSLSKHSVKIGTTELSTDTRGIPIGNISDCGGASSLWIAVLISLLKNKYFSEKVEEEEIVYSGSMVNVPLLEKQETSLILANNYDMVDSSKFTVDDIINTKLNFETGHKRHHKNDWLLERYKDQLEDTYLNLVGDKGCIEVTVNGCSRDMYCFDRNYIGTKESIEYTREYIARKNLATQVEILFEKEVQKELIYLRQWYERRLSERKDFLKMVIARETCILTKYEYTRIKEDKLEAWKNGGKLGYDDTYTFQHSYDQFRKEDCLRVNYNPSEESYNVDAQLYQKKDYNKRSFFNSKPVFAVYHIHVNNTKAICEVLGCGLSELPELLQHWYPMSCTGEGNSILYDVDPVEHIRNALSAFSADIRLYVSKSEIREIKKELGYNV